MLRGLGLRPPERSFLVDTASPETRMTRSLLLALSLCLPLLSGAQTAWPEKPIRIVLPYPPGGPSDIVMRAAGEKMLVSLKQPLVIDNKPGAGGIWAPPRSRARRPMATPGWSRRTPPSLSTRTSTNRWVSSPTT